MYQCSCVDFAVHATVCKHVHTVHELRTKGAVAQELVSEVVIAASLSDDTGGPPENSDVEPDAERTSEHRAESTNSNRYNTIVQGYLTQCRQSMALVAAGTISEECLLTAAKHLRAANAALRAASVKRISRLAVATRLAANKKLDVQFRFRSMRAKGRPRNAGMRKPMQRCSSCICAACSETQKRGGTRLKHLIGVKCLGRSAVRRRFVLRWHRRRLKLDRYGT